MKVSNLALLGLLFLSACSVTPLAEPVGPTTFELARLSGSSGAEDVYQLDKSSKGWVLKVRTEVPKDRIYVGLTVEEVTQPMATSLGLAAYEGLMISRIAERSPASAAGLLPGDLLERVGNITLSFDDTYAHAVRQYKAGESVEFHVQRRSGSELNGRVFPVKIGSKAFLEIEMRQVKLEHVQLPDNPWLGCSMRQIPAAYAATALGFTNPALMISSVRPGSPVYLAGLRPGDVVLSMGGVKNPSPDAVGSILRERVSAGETVGFEVRREAKVMYSCEVTPLRDASLATAYVPILFRSSSDPEHTRWSLGPWGSLMSYRGYYKDSETRQSESYSYFSAILGLIQHTSTKDRRTTRLLWIFSFSS